MSFLQLVLSLDKTKEEIILLWRICQFDRYRNISLSLKNVMFVMSVIAQLVLGGVFCGNQSNCRNCRICRICILIGECWNGVDSLEILEILEHCRICKIAWKGWKVMNDWNVRNVSGATGVTGVAFVRTCGWNAWNVIGRSCKTHGCISRRSPCLLCVEFLFWNEGLFALWNVVVVLEELFVFCM